LSERQTDGGDGVSGGAFAAPNEPETLISGCLNSNSVDSDAADRGDTRPHRLSMGRNLWTFADIADI
jgi:hypothetical protein